MGCLNRRRGKALSRIALVMLTFTLLVSGCAPAAMSDQITIPERETPLSEGLLGLEDDVASTEEDSSPVTQGETEQFSVQFYDVAGEPIGEPQIVEKGSQAQAPEPPVVENRVFAGWSSEAYLNVQADASIFALYEYVDLPLVALSDDNQQLQGEPATLIVNATPGVGEHKTLTSALESAKDGDAIVIKGTVVEKTAININKSVTIAGYDADSSFAMNFKATSEAMLTIDAPNVVFSNLEFAKTTITNGSTAADVIRVNNTGFVMRNCTVNTGNSSSLAKNDINLNGNTATFTNCTFNITVANRTAIYLPTYSQPVFSGCTFTLATATGTGISAANSFDAASPLSFSGCSFAFTNGGTGILINNQSDVPVHMADLQFSTTAGVVHGVNLNGNKAVISNTQFVSGEGSKASGNFIESVAGVADLTLETSTFTTVSTGNNMQGIALSSLDTASNVSFNKVTVNDGASNNYFFTAPLLNTLTITDSTLYHVAKSFSIGSAERIDIKKTELNHEGYGFSPSPIAKVKELAITEGSVIKQGGTIARIGIPVEGLTSLVISNSVLEATATGKGIGSRIIVATKCDNAEVKISDSQILSTLVSAVEVTNQTLGGESSFELTSSLVEVSNTESSSPGAFALTNFDAISFDDKSTFKVDNVGTKVSSAVKINDSTNIVVDKTLFEMGSYSQGIVFTGSKDIEIVGSEKIEAKNNNKLFTFTDCEDVSISDIQFSGTATNIVMSLKDTNSFTITDSAFTLGESSVGISISATNNSGVSAYVSREAVDAYKTHDVEIRDNTFTLSGEGSKGITANQGNRIIIKNNTFNCKTSEWAIRTGTGYAYLVEGNTINSLEGTVTHGIVSDGMDDSDPWVDEDYDGTEVTQSQYRDNTFTGSFFTGMWACNNGELIEENDFSGSTCDYQILVYRCNEVSLAGNDFAATADDSSPAVFLSNATVSSLVDNTFAVAEDSESALAVLGTQNPVAGRIDSKNNKAPMPDEKFVDDIKFLSGNTVGLNDTTVTEIKMQGTKDSLTDRYVSVEVPYKLVLSVSRYTVTFDSQGGGGIAPLKDVLAGELIAAPTAPQRSGYSFEGWYKEQTTQNKWLFTSDTVTKDVTLYAMWKALPAPDASSVPPTTPVSPMATLAISPVFDSALLEQSLQEETDNTDTLKEDDEKSVRDSAASDAQGNSSIDDAHTSASTSTYTVPPVEHPATPEVYPDLSYAALDTINSWPVENREELQRIKEASIPIVEILATPVPLHGLDEGTVWSLVNLLLVAIGFILGIVIGIRAILSRRRTLSATTTDTAKHQKVMPLAALVSVGVCTLLLVILFLTQDTVKLMVFVDGLTAVMALIIVIELALAVFFSTTKGAGKKRRVKNSV